MLGFRRAVDLAKGKQRAAKDAVAAASLGLAQAEDELATVQEGAAVIREVAAALQQEIHGRIAGLVTSCLSAVYVDPYEFCIDFVERRGKTEADVALQRAGEAFDPQDEVGGGPVDVASLALRLAALSATRPAVRRLLVLDEPFRFVGVANRDEVRLMLESLCAEMGFQIVMVTHAADLVCGKVVEL